MKGRNISNSVGLEIVVVVVLVVIWQEENMLYNTNNDLNDNMIFAQMYIYIMRANFLNGQKSYVCLSR